LRTIALFCGSNPGADPAFAAAAAAFGAETARRGLRLVYGGGSVGLMGIAADAALAGGGEVVGVIPRFLLEREVGHAGLTELRVVESMHERKALMASLADAFVALPGGIGTLEELFEIWSWGQLGLHDKPCALLDVAGYFTALVDFLDGAVRMGFVRAQHRALLLTGETPAELLDRLARAATPSRRTPSRQRGSA
jgi:uncharacterized protein (TIGR00730 family)